VVKVHGDTAGSRHAADPAVAGFLDGPAPHRIVFVSRG